MMRPDFYPNPCAQDITARRVLDRFLTEHFADCIDLVEVRQVVEIGAPYKNIVEKAAEEGVDMIVMSTHGRTRVDHFILGSVAEKVVARAPCPVLSCRGAGGTRKARKPLEKRASVMRLRSPITMRMDEHDGPRLVVPAHA